MKHILILFILLWLSYTSASQTITVKDADTGEAIKIVDIISKHPQIYSQTNTLGQADISDFKFSKEIEIHAPGYKTRFTTYEQLSKDKTIRLEASNISLDGVVVSAMRRNQTSDNVPAEIVAISQKEIEIQNPQTSADLLGISNHVFIQKSQQGGGSPMIRGFATNRLLYSVDNVRMNTAIYRSGNIQNVINIDPFTIENAEILFGPGSVSYGSDAIGGVMSFKTLTPQLSLKDKTYVSGKALSRYSSANNEKSGHFDINIAWKKWASVTSFSYWNFDNLRQGKHGPEDYIKDYYVQRKNAKDLLIKQDNPLLQIPSAYSQTNLMQKIRYTPKQNWDIQYGLHYSETSPYGRYDRHNRSKNGTARYAEWNYGPQKWLLNNLSIEHKGNTTLYDNMIVHLAHQYFEESRISRSFNKTDRSVKTEHVNAYSVNLDFIKSAGTKLTLSYGAEYVLNKVLSESFITDIQTQSQKKGSARYPNAFWHSAGIYLNNEYEISEQITLASGIRYNYNILNADFSNNTVFYPFPFSSTHINKGSLTGSIGAVFRPAQTWVVNINFGTAFRAPNLDDIGKVFDSEPGTVIVPNPELKAEYAYNIDFGFAKNFGNIIKLDFTTYYTILNRAMVRKDFTLNGADSIMYDGELSKVQAVQNAASAEIYGIQGGIEIKILKGFSFTSDINYQKGEEKYEDGSRQPSRHVAPLFGTSSLQYRTKKLELKFYSVYMGEKKHADMPASEQKKSEIYAKDSKGNTYTPAWYTLNLKAKYKLSKKFSFSIGIENISDQRYRPYSSGISAAGRNFIFALSFKFG